MPDGDEADGRSIKRTCSPSDDQNGLTQQPPSVSCRAAGNGVGDGASVAVGQVWGVIVADRGRRGRAGRHLGGRRRQARGSKVATRVGIGCEQAAESALDSAAAAARRAGFMGRPIRAARHGRIGSEFAAKGYVGLIVEVLPLARVVQVRSKPRLPVAPKASASQSASMSVTGL